MRYKSSICCSVGGFAVHRRLDFTLRRCGTLLLRLSRELLVFLLLAVGAQTAPAQQTQTLRFAVAHDHKFSWCYGYLYDFRSQDGTTRGLDIDPNGTIPGLNTYVRTCHCNGARFSGTYCWGNKSLTMTFLPDGRFVDRGAMHDAFQYNYPQDPHITDPGVGTYRIVDYTIYFDYANSRHLKQSFVVIAHPSKTPSGMWINGASFNQVPGTSSDPTPAESNASGRSSADAANSQGAQIFGTTRMRSGPGTSLGPN